MLRASLVVIARSPSIVACLYHKYRYFENSEKNLGSSVNICNYVKRNFSGIESGQDYGLVETSWNDPYVYKYMGHSTEDLPLNFFSRLIFFLFVLC